MNEQIERHDKNEYRSPVMESVVFEIQGAAEPALTRMLDFTLEKLTHRLGNRANQLIGNVTVKIGPGLVDGGGQAITEENLVLLDYEKMKMTLQESEDFLVREGWFETGERTRVLPDIKYVPWSTVVYELTHELGHIAGSRAGVDVDSELSPTKYGRRARHEAFAEAFTYWVFEAGQNLGTAQVVERICHSQSS